MEIFSIATLISVILLASYFLRRSHKVIELKLSLIKFYAGEKAPDTMNEWQLYFKRREWFRSLASTENMIWSFKPLKSFITGEFADEALEYLKSNGRIN